MTAIKACMTLKPPPRRAIDAGAEVGRSMLMAETAGEGRRNAGPVADEPCLGLGPSPDGGGFQSLASGSGSGPGELGAEGVPADRVGDVGAGTPQ